MTTNKQNRFRSAVKKIITMKKVIHKMEFEVLKKHIMANKKREQAAAACDFKELKKLGKETIKILVSEYGSLKETVRNVSKSLFIKMLMNTCSHAAIVINKKKDGVNDDAAYRVDFSGYEKESNPPVAASAYIIDYSSQVGEKLKSLFKEYRKKNRLIIGINSNAETQDGAKNALIVHLCHKEKEEGKKKCEEITSIIDGDEARFPPGSFGFIKHKHMVFTFYISEVGEEEDYEEEDYADAKRIYVSGVVDTGADSIFGPGIQEIVDAGGSSFDDESERYDSNKKKDIDSKKIRTMRWEINGKEYDISHYFKKNGTGGTRDFYKAVSRELSVKEEPVSTWKKVVFMMFLVLDFVICTGVALGITSFGYFIAPLAAILWYQCMHKVSNAQSQMIGLTGGRKSRRKRKKSRYKRKKSRRKRKKSRYKRKKSHRIKKTKKRRQNR